MAAGRIAGRGSLAQGEPRGAPRHAGSPLPSTIACGLLTLCQLLLEHPMRISVVQMNPGADKEANIAQARRLIGEAVDADRPDIVSLPEVWDSLGGDRTVRNANAEILPARGSNQP